MTFPSLFLYPLKLSMTLRLVVNFQNYVLGFLIHITQFKCVAFAPFHSPFERRLQNPSGYCFLVQIKTFVI